jgi:hypothetical protein
LTLFPTFRGSRKVILFTAFTWVGDDCRVFLDYIFANGEDCPVTHISFLETNEFIQKLCEKEKIKDCKELHECAVGVASRFLSNDPQLGLMILFSFDFLYLTHKCVSEYLEKGSVSNDNIVRLKERI